MSHAAASHVFLAGKTFPGILYGHSQGIVIIFKGNRGVQSPGMLHNIEEQFTDRIKYQHAHFLVQLGWLLIRPDPYTQIILFLHFSDPPTSRFYPPPLLDDLSTAIYAERGRRHEELSQE